MTARRYFVGLDLDIVSGKMAASIGIAPWKLLAGPVTFSESLEGYQELITWVRGYHCLPADTLFCMEETGFCGEPVAYFLAANGYTVAVETLVKVRRTFPDSNGWGYELGSQHIARYAFRFLGELHPWQPSPELLQEVQLLLAKCDSLHRARPVKGTAATGSESTSDPSRGALKQKVFMIDEQIRRLLKPQATIASDWPCF